MTKNIENTDIKNDTSRVFFALLASHIWEYKLSIEIWSTNYHKTQTMPYTIIVHFEGHVLWNYSRDQNVIIEVSHAEKRQKSREIINKSGDSIYSIYRN